MKKIRIEDRKGGSRDRDPGEYGKELVYIT